MERLRKRADFLAAARGIRRVAGAVTLEMAPTPIVARETETLRVWVSPPARKSAMPWPATAPSGGLRAAASQLLPLSGRAGP